MEKKLSIQSTAHPDVKLTYNEFQLYIRKQLGIEVNVKLYNKGVKK